MSQPSLSIGFVVFPVMTQLDFTGPLQVLCRAPGAKIHIAAKTMEPMKSDAQLMITPTVSFADCPPLDILVVPGGHGVADAAQDKETVDFVRSRAAEAKWVTSVCTGAFILGAAGLLDGKRATTHWAYKELLPLVGAIPADGRVVKDGNVITGGGVTAGIDFAFTLMSEIAGPEVAQAVQLALEYDPAPPFRAGTPELAPAGVRERLEDRVYQKARERMRDAIG